MNENEKNLTMDLGQCENILKDVYNISKNDSLYILQLISEEEGMKIPKVEYEIYYPLYNNKTLAKLNLTYCEGTKIEISISVKINDTIDKYNSSSDYYNNICTKANSKSGTDISLKDRRNEFVENNMSLCEENCDLISYNYTNQKAKCSCDVKLNITQNYDFNFNKKDFFKNFIDIKNIANISILKCYNIVLNIENIIKNYGFYIIGFIMFLYILTIFIFRYLSFKKIKNDLSNILVALKRKEPIQLQSSNNKKLQKNKEIKKKKKKKKNLKNVENNYKENITNYNDNNLQMNLQNNNKKGQKKNSNYLGQITQNMGDKLTNKINPINEINLNSVDINKINLNAFLKRKDFEINSLEYEEAFNLDKRNYFQYYISLLKNNHPIMFSFSSYKDYNSRIIKMFLFFFSFSLDFTVNALFFSDETMHKIYQDKGEYNFLYQIPQIIYSTLISRFIDTLIKKFLYLKIT